MSTWPTGCSKLASCVGGKRDRAFTPIASCKLVYNEWTGGGVRVVTEGEGGVVARALVLHLVPYEGFRIKLLQSLLSPAPFANAFAEWIIEDSV